MKLLRRLLRNCSSFFFLLFSFFLFSFPVFARVDSYTPVDFSDCGTDGLSCSAPITGTDLDLISTDDDNNYPSSIWPDSLFAFSGETAWNDNDNPYLMQFNFNPSISDYIVSADFVFDSVFNPNVCSTFTECRFKLLSSVDGFSNTEKLHEQSDLIISPPLVSSIPSSQLGNLDTLSVKLLAYGTPLGNSAGVQSLIDQVRLDVHIDDTPPTVSNIRMFVNGVESTFMRPGDLVEVKANITDTESGMGQVRLLARSVTTTGGGYIDSGYFVNTTGDEYVRTFTFPADGKYIDTHLPITSDVNGLSFYIKSFDQAGNYTNSSSTHFTYDKVVPSMSNIKMYVSTDGGINYFEKDVVKPNDLVRIEVEANDLESGVKDVEFRVKGKSGGYIAPRTYISSSVFGNTYRFEYQVPADGKYIDTHGLISETLNTHVFWARVTDMVGNYNHGISGEFSYDITPPNAPSLISPANNAVVNGSVLLSDWTTVSDADHYIYESYHNAAATNLRWRAEYKNSQKSASNVADSEFWWRVKAVDLAGNESAWSDLWHVSIDNIGPTVDLKNPLVGSIRGQVDIIGSVTDDHPHHYWLVIQNSVGTTVAGPGVVNDTMPFTDKLFFTWDTTSVSDGTYTIKLHARDSAGNKDANSVIEIDVVVDNTSPTITFTQPLTTSIHSGVVHLQATCDEECDYVNFWWRKEGELYTPADKRYHYVHTNGTVFDWDLDTLNAEKADGTFYPLSDGTYYLYTAGKDVIGNWAKTSEISMVVDNTDPTVNITSPLDGQVISGTTTVTIDANDATSGMDRVELYDRPVGGSWNYLDTIYSPYTYDWNTTGYPLGDYELMAKAFDLAGNESSDQIEVGVAAVISGESGSTPYFGQIYVSWFTDRPTTAQVVYDIVPHPIPDTSVFNYGYAFTTGVFDLGKTLFHETLLTGLNDQTTYYYRFISAGSPAAISQEMSNKTFSMAGPGSPPSGGGGAAAPLLASTPSVLGTYTYYPTGGANLPDEGEVLGDETEPSPTPEELTPTPTSAPSESKVLGTITSTSPLYFLGAGLLISLILMLLLFRRK